MKLPILYEDNIRNGHKYYITLEIPDGQYANILDADYEQRLAQADPEKRDQVRRFNTMQELCEDMNRKEYNNWHKHNRHLGSTQAQKYEDEDTGDDGSGAAWCEPLMEEVLDDRVFRRDEIERDERESYEAICQWIRSVLVKKPNWADAFIAVRMDGMSVNDYAASIGLKDASIVSKWLARAAKKLEAKYQERQI